MSGAGDPAGAATRQERNDMMPYTPIDALHAMHREYFKDNLNRDDRDALDRRANQRWDDHPDPLGLAWTRLRPGEWLQAGLARLGRLGRAAAVRPRRRTA